MSRNTHVVVKPSRNVWGVRALARFPALSQANRYAKACVDARVMSLLDYDELLGHTGGRHYFAKRYSCEQLRFFAATIENEIVRVNLSREDLPYRDKEILAARRMIDA